MELKVTNVNQALSEGLAWLLVAGIEQPSRNGPVLVSPEPVMTTYTNPKQRVLFSPVRDANPFFHFMEALWMLAGRNDLSFPESFNKRFSEYSDDGQTVYGAYGRRWRSWFGFDQLNYIADELRANPGSRRAVLTMWDGAQDLFKAINLGKDVPCNTHVYFERREDKLNMTVCCRSNDIIWGAYGANAVHFSFLQEFMASWIGVEVGVYRQFSNNWHAYVSLFKNGREDMRAMSIDAQDRDLYESTDIIHTPLVDTNIPTWQEDLTVFMDPYRGLAQPEAMCSKFFKYTAYPMMKAWQHRKLRLDSGLEWAKRICSEDWRTACVQWIERREIRKAQADAAAAR